jgi:hypothetical protein
MTFRESRLSLQLLVEEQIGAARYHAAEEARAIEDAAWAKATGKVN